MNIMIEVPRKEQMKQMDEQTLIRDNNAWALDRQLAQEEKAARMLEIYATERFNTPVSAQKMRFRLVAWVIRNKLQGNIKRVFDTIVALIALFLLSPFMLIVAIAVKLNSPGPIIFKQKRIGKWGHSFQCYKFRSMYVDAEERKAELMSQNEADGVVFKMKNDPRVTKVGRFTRKTSLDELPQLINVLKGEMSLVGPRPPVPAEVEQYQFEDLGRLGAVPGITGLQQVSGRSTLDFKTWVELDLQYIEEQSLGRDIQILLKTIPAVLMSKGAY